ncbi:MAG TPA: hypothetical protein V6C85_39060 [Allocoleopsis sp.]
MYDTIQNILTYLIEAIAIIGFCGCWIHHSLSKSLDEITSWGKPQPLLEQTERNYKIEGNDLNEFFDTTVKDGLKSTTPTQNISICDDSPISEIYPSENQPPTFEGYSQSRLRRIARELQIGRYTQMKRWELITAIASHPEAQRVCVP